MASVIRLLDVIFAFLGLVSLFPLLLLLFLVGLWDTGSPLFRQQRVGRDQSLFVLTKFRTMAPGTHSVATHLVDGNAITPFGRFLRKTKLDELPQLWNVLMGDMSLVGPRPCLPSQRDLIEARAGRRVFEVRPGITGLAQIQGVDMSTPELLAATDAKMLDGLNVWQYFHFIFLTIVGRGSGDRVVR